VKLPENQGARHGFFRDLIRTIELPSRQDRRERFRRMRGLNLTGTDTLDRARYNALKEWEQLSTSLVYASENLQFGMTVPPYYGDRWDEELVLAREELHRLWFDGDATEVANQVVSQAHYADSSIAKLIVNRNEASLAIIADPSDFGVGDEHLPIEQQEVFVHWYSASLPTFWRMIHASEMDEEARKIAWARAEAHATPYEDNKNDNLPPAVQSLILASASPTMVGNVQSVRDTMLAIPQSRTPVVQLAELWVWDDRAGRLCKACLERKESWRHAWPSNAGGHTFDPGDYVPDWRVVTNFLATEAILYEPVNPLGIEGHAFFPLTLGPMPGYTWGIAPQEHLVGLQLWRERNLAELDLRDQLDVDPPLAMYGVPSRDGETSKAWRKPGGDIFLTMPNSKVDPVKPAPLPDKFEFIREIDGMLRAMQGIPKSMAGQADQAQRSGDQTIATAMLGAGPTLSRAMLVEDWLEHVATAMMRLHRNLLDRPLVKSDGTRFLLRQMPSDFIARVWAHSASPIYTEHLTQKALIAHKQKLIDGRDALTFLNLPGTDMLLRTQKKLEKAQGEQTEKVISLKEKEVEAKVLRAMK
jgi:hypothetical protein